MSNQSLEIKVPGKLFIAGEYAVLEPKQPAVVIAVNRYMKAKISPSEKNQLILPHLGKTTLSWVREGNRVKIIGDRRRTRFVKNAMEVCFQFLKEKGIQIRPFSLQIVSELNDPSGKKYGLGSSAAVVVAVVSAILNFFKYPTNKKVIFKLATIAHFKTQGNGSCADIAASTYGGWIQYAVFNQRWLKSKIHHMKRISALVSRDWPGLKIKPIYPPKDLVVCVGWTGKKASTASMVEEIQRLKKDYLQGYEDFLRKSRNAVYQLIDSFSKNDISGAFEGLTNNRLALMNLGKMTGVDIETDQLRTLIKIASKYGSGKSSGAGGGDCGIAFVKSNAEKEQLLKEWDKSGISPLDLDVSPTGASVKVLGKSNKGPVNSQ